MKKKKPAIYFKKWDLKDCESDIRKFEIDWGPHNNESRRYKGFGIWIGSKYFGAIDITFVDNVKGYLSEYKNDILWAGKKIF